MPMGPRKTARPMLRPPAASIATTEGLAPHVLGSALSPTGS